MRTASARSLCRDELVAASPSVADTPSSSLLGTNVPRCAFFAERKEARLSLGDLRAGELTQTRDPCHRLDSQGRRWRGQRESLVPAPRLSRRLLLCGGGKILSRGGGRPRSQQLPSASPERSPASSPPFCFNRSTSSKPAKYEAQQQSLQGIGGSLARKKAFCSLLSVRSNNTPETASPSPPGLRPLRFSEKLESPGSGEALFPPSFEWRRGQVNSKEFKKKFLLPFISLRQRAQPRRVCGGSVGIYFGMLDSMVGTWGGVARFLQRFPPTAKLEVGEKEGVLLFPHRQELTVECATVSVHPSQVDPSQTPSWYMGFVSAAARGGAVVLFNPIGIVKTRMESATVRPPARPSASSKGSSWSSFRV